MGQEVLVKVEGLSKKFCKSLKKSLKYGMYDLVANLRGKDTSDDLRPDEFWALKDINFELKRGECLGLIGHNGAGKSTLLKILNGLINPDHGKVTMRGRVGALIELGAGFNPIMTGRENIYNNGAVLGFSKQEIDAKLEDIIEFAELREFIDMPVRNYSSGMKVRLGFSVAAQMEPDVLIIDEVLAVGDLSFRMKCYHHLMNVMSKNVALIVVSHNMVDIMRLSSDVIVMKKGKVEFHGNTNKAVGIYNTLGVSSSDEGENNVSVTLQCDNENNDFATGDDLVFDIIVNSNREVLDARVMSHLEFSNIRLSSISSKYLNFTINLKKGVNRIRMSYPNNPLLVGGYMANFEVYGSDLREFVGSAETILFYITEPEVNFNLDGRCHIIAFDHNWKVLE